MVSFQLSVKYIQLPVILIGNLIRRMYMGFRLCVLRVHNMCSVLLTDAVPSDQDHGG